MDAVELLMNVTPNETRIALVETGMLREVHIERQAKRGIVGNIYKGRVTRVLPGMQSAFVDIGLEKAAFLHAADIVSHTECVDENEQKQFKVKSISELVREGQDIVVQVVKDPLGTKHCHRVILFLCRKIATWAFHNVLKAKKNVPV